jgi:hypothetical protein
MLAAREVEHFRVLRAQVNGRQSGQAPKRDGKPLGGFDRDGAHTKEAGTVEVEIAAQLIQSQAHRGKQRGLHSPYRQKPLLDSYLDRDPLNLIECQLILVAVIELRGLG